MIKPVSSLKASRIRRAVFPIAGLGTRFLPATKSVPKEMLTLVDRPLIQYAVEEARVAGIEEFIFVTGGRTSAVEAHFRDSASLEEHLENKGKHELAAIARSTTLPRGSMTFVSQDIPRGSGHAIWCAREHLADEPFAVLYPDDVIHADQPCLAQMVEAYQGGALIAAMHVDPDKTHNYGMIDAEIEAGRSSVVRRLVEKPAPGECSSTLATVGRFILSASILERLEHLRPGAGGEINITDAIDQEIRSGTPVSAFRFQGDRYDCGSQDGYLQAVVDLALARDELAPGLRRHIQKQVGAHPGAAR